MEVSATSAAGTTCYLGPMDPELIEQMDIYKSQQQSTRQPWEVPQGVNGCLTPLRKIGLMSGDDPDNFEDVKNTARIRFMMGDYAKGLLMLLARRDQVDKDPVASELLGITAGEMDLRDLAAQALGVGVALDPGNALKRLNFARSLCLYGAHDRANTEFMEAIRLAPSSKRAHEEYVEFLLETGQLEQVIAHTSEFLEHQSFRDPTMLAMRGVAQRGLHHLEEAQKDFEAATALNERHTLALMQKFSIFVQAGKIDEAAQVARKLFINI